MLLTTGTSSSHYCLHSNEALHATTSDFRVFPSVCASLAEVEAANSLEVEPQRLLEAQSSTVGLSVVCFLIIKHLGNCISISMVAIHHHLDVNYFCKERSKGVFASHVVFYWTRSSYWHVSLYSLMRLTEKHIGTSLLWMECQEVCKTTPGMV